MPESMIERLTDILFARCGGISRERLAATARVLLDAMREPTEAMLVEGMRFGATERGYTAMIDAALAE